MPQSTIAANLHEINRRAHTILLQPPRNLQAALPDPNTPAGRLASRDFAFQRGEDVVVLRVEASLAWDVGVAAMVE